MRWDVSCSPDLSNLFVSPRWSSAHCLFHLLGGTIGGWPCQSGPSRHNLVASLQSLSRQLLSFHLGCLPRVAARDMQNEVATYKMAFYGLLDFSMYLTVLLCGVQSPGTGLCFAHLSASVGLLCLWTKTLWDFLISVTCYLFSSGT